MTAIHQSRERAVEAAEKLKVYAQPQRLMILSRLLDGERTVGEIEDATRIGQPALSQQLAELRRAGLVETRRVAKQVFYRLANDNVSLCVRSIEAIFGSGRDVAAALSGAMAARPRQTPIRRAGAAVFAQVE
jgi:DNA-binding transcriptional ArsR family regulator